MTSLPQTWARAEELPRGKTQHRDPVPQSQQGSLLCINCHLFWNSAFKHINSREEMAWLPKNRNQTHQNKPTEKTITTLPTSDKYRSLSRARQTQSLPLGPPSELSARTHVATSRTSGENALKEAIHISQGQTIFIS